MLNRSKYRSSQKEVTIRQLKCLQAVCRLGSYAAAAREMALTTSSVWEQIRSLESLLGSTLLERHRNGARATLRGLRLLELTHAYLEAIDSIQDLFLQEGDAFPVKLTLVTHLRVLIEEIGAAMGSFRQKFPTVGLSFMDIRASEMQKAVLDGTADVALTLEAGPSTRWSRTVRFEPLGELDYLLMLPSGHPLTQRRSFRIGNLIDFPIVVGMPGSYTRERAEEVFHRHDLIEQMNIAAEMTSDAQIPACIRGGLGIGIGIGLAEGSQYHGLEVRILRKWFGTATMGLLWRREAAVPPLQRELASLLKTNIFEN